MAHFAQLDENNVVANVLVIADEDCQDENGNESEAVGVAFCKNLLGQDIEFKQCSYNNNIRAHYPAIGAEYRAAEDVFVNPKEFPSWVLNTTTWEYEAPLALPDDADTVVYYWDEAAYQADNSTGWTAAS